MRLAQIAAAFLIPVVAVVLALTLRTGSSDAPLSVHAESGSYKAIAGTPLSVSAFRIANTRDTSVTITRVSVAGSVPGLQVIGALAYRGCDGCIANSAVPPHITGPTGVPTPPLLPVKSFLLEPDATLTLLLSVRVSHNGRVHVPPLRIDLITNPHLHTHATVQTTPGPELCAGKGC